MEEANTLAAVIGGKQVSLFIKTGEGGKVFGSVSSKEIAKALLQQHGREIDKKKLMLDEPVKSLGVFEVGVKLHPQVTAKLTVHVKNSGS